MNVKGRFVCRFEDGSMSVFDNEITQAGVQRILELMGGQSAQPWQAIRLVGANPSEFVQKEVTTSVATGKLISKAVFSASELYFSAVKAEMYSGSVKVATAPVGIPAGQTVYVEREDLLTAN